MPTKTDAPRPKPAGRYRWRICALLFFATTINYIDRLVLGILAPQLQHDIGWTEAQYGNIVTAFQAAYAMGLLIAGGVMDRIGVKLGYAISVVVWSAASMAHSLARGPFSFGVARFALGLGESGNFPAAIKTVSEWFPDRERALAIGIFNAGSNVGAILAPLAIPFLASRYGWRSAFLLTGVTDLCWLICWLSTYRKPQGNPKVSREELAYIESGTPLDVAPIPLRTMLRSRQTWAYALAKFLTDPVWWFYLFWLPKFLNQTRGLSLSRLGLPLVVIYIAADLGSIGGGWASSELLRLGWPASRARKTVMLVCACAVVPIFGVTYVLNLWAAVALIGVATAAHQGWSANLYASASDMFPPAATGTITGFGGMAGAIGGMLLAFSAGQILQLTGSYVPLFAIAGSVYLVALAVLHVLTPGLEPVRLTTIEAYTNTRL